MSEVYEKYFGYKTDGTFVEVGAHDGYSFSNTWELVQAGWRGIMYEPMKELFEKCQSLYINKSVTVIQSCVGAFCGEVDLFVAGCPTIDLETVERSPWGFKYDRANTIKSPITTLNVSLQELKWDHDFDVLCVDVEGAELQVLNGINLSLWRPKLIIIETHEGHPDVARRYHVQAINDYFFLEDYTKVQVDGLNTMFLRNL